MTDNKSLILAGDIGGTKTNLGLFLRGKKRPRPRVIETYSSKDAPNLLNILEQFIELHTPQVSVACFGIAGPVTNGKCQATNLPWSVSEAEIINRFKWARVRLINDLAATAMAIPFLNYREVFSLNRARVRKGRGFGLVAPGTGLGQALLVPGRDGYIPVSSEGGHVDFSPQNNAQIELLRYLGKKYGHVSAERVLSGPGLFNIYSWMKDSGQYKEPAWLRKKINSTDPAMTIAKIAMEKGHPLCTEALDMFVSILGAVSGNLALTAFTTGGVYLGGGIPPKILPRLMQGPFMKSFTDKGRFRSFMEKIPVRVILNDRAAILGAAHCALEIGTQ